MERMEFEKHPDIEGPCNELEAGVAVGKPVTTSNVDTDFYVSEPVATPPQSYKSATQQAIFATLASLAIPFLRVDTGDGTTMEACIPIGEKLRNRVIKTVFLTYRHVAQFQK